MQTDEEIKKEIIDKLQNEWGVDNRDSDSFDKWVTELFVSKINTLQEEYKKELIEKIEKTGVDLGEGRVLDIAWSDLKQNIITIINNINYPSL